MKMYRINDTTVIAELDDGTKYEIPWDVDKAIQIQCDSLESFATMAGHLALNKTK